MTCRRIARCPAVWLIGLLALGLPAGRTFPAGSAPPVLPPLVIEDFEAAAIGSLPYLWKEQKERKQSGVDATIGVERAPLDGNDANKGLKFEYSFAPAFASAQALEAGPMGQPLPGSLTHILVMVYGDRSKNAVGLRLKDSTGETFEWQTPIEWIGWKQLRLDLKKPADHRSGPRASAPPVPPLTFEAVRLIRLAGGAARGEVILDHILAGCDFDRTRAVTLYDPDDKTPASGWKVNLTRCVAGRAVGDEAPRFGKNAPALKLEYEYQSGTDSSAELSKIIPAGNGHGTLVAEVFGDGSNNILRFRMLDGADRLWQANWATILIDWSGWKTLYLDPRTLREADGTRPGAVLDRFPLKFSGLVVDDVSPGDGLPGVESGRKGEIYLGRLLFFPEQLRGSRALPEPSLPLEARILSP